MLAQNLTVISPATSMDEIEIGNISGGISRIKADIINTGETPITEVAWEISINGGILKRINQQTTGVESEIPANQSKTIRSSPFFGLGRINIKITVNNVDKNVNGLILFFFIIIFPEQTIEFETIATGLPSPVGLVNAGDGSNRLFIVDQTGKIFVIDNNILLNEPFLDISDKIVELDTTYDERGLLGLVFHPDYAENGRFFVYYSSSKTGPGINHEGVLAEYLVSLDPNVADPNSEKIIYRVDQPEANHNGGQLCFGPDSYLYIGLGDGGGAGDQHGIIGNGQDINTSLGAILRIDIDSGSPYSIPSDNPFVGTDGLDEIYAWGFRNPWKFSFDRGADQLWVADVGQDEWEEIDIVQIGENYGWRILEGTHPYDLDLADLLGINIEDLASPIHEYSHSVGRSITGGHVYRGNNSKFLQGKYVFGDWSTGFFIPNGKIYYLEEVEPNLWDRFELVPTQPFNRFVTSFGEDEQGELYVCSKTNLGPTGTSGDVRRLIVD
jgi:glucose/arabinose dehydrogenase